MHRALIIIALAILLGGNASCVSRAPVTPAERPAAANLDDLFARLQTAHSPEEAQMIEVAIRHAWASSGQRSVDVMMGRAVEYLHAGEYGQALKVMDGVVASAPDFAEGWNLRATVNYLNDDYGAALRDIEHVLALEPRHFGALAGLGRIFLELEDEKSALKAFEAALALNPHLDDVRQEINELREQLAGIPI